MIAGYLREKEGRMCDQFSDSHGERERDERAESGVCDNNTLRWLMVRSIWERRERTKPEQSFIADGGAAERPTTAVKSGLQTDMYGLKGGP